MVREKLIRNVVFAIVLMFLLSGCAISRSERFTLDENQNLKAFEIIETRGFWNLNGQEMYRSEGTGDDKNVLIFGGVEISPLTKEQAEIALEMLKLSGGKL